jgi:sigma-B regulation protein RsbU (phosphoserine phosphatase)
LRAASLADLTDERATAALREQFIAVLGHDLRNPLSAIVNGTDALQRMELDLRASMLVGMMRRSAERMSHLIDDVMDFARGRLSGGFPLERSANAPVEAVLRQVVHELQVSTPDREGSPRTSQSRLPSTATAGGSGSSRPTCSPMR